MLRGGWTSLPTELAAPLLRLSRRAARLERKESLNGGATAKHDGSGLPSTSNSSAGEGALASLVAAAAARGAIALPQVLRLLDFCYVANKRLLAESSVNVVGSTSRTSGKQVASSSSADVVETSPSGPSSLESCERELLCLAQEQLVQLQLSLATRSADEFAALVDGRTVRRIASVLRETVVLREQLRKSSAKAEAEGQGGVMKKSGEREGPGDAPIIL